MNTLLSQVANWFEHFGRKTANVEIIDWDEIDHMRQRLVQMRFAKPAVAEGMVLAPETQPDQSSLKGAFASTNIRSKDRNTIRRWSGSQSIFSDSQSDKFDSSGISVSTKYGAQSQASAAANTSTQGALSIEERVDAQRFLMRSKLIATSNQPMPSYDLDNAREIELRAAMEHLESSVEH